jgi:predicted RNA-binding protein with RPS1 domain
VRPHITTGAPALRKPQFLTVGDEVTVFVKSVSKNSGQFSLTMDASAQLKSPQDLKRESEVTKRLSRLSKQLGGFDQIQQLYGKECDGLVKATSNTGDWHYVEPSLENVPIGVAFVPESIDEPLARGDGVRIQIQGVDEERGQLSMRILRRL